jgi:hypothetical protein
MPQDKLFNEKNVLLGIIVVFILGIFWNLTSGITGFVVTGQDNKTIIKVNETFFKNSKISLNTTENITSVRITGEIIGNGTAKIYFNDLLILDSDLIKKKSNLITGKIVQEIGEIKTTIENITQKIEEENNLSEIVGVQSINETIIEINETIELQNITDEIELNITINESVDINKTEQTFTINETVKINETEEITITISKYFNNYCVDTCVLNTNESVIIIELNNTKLRLDAITYTINQIGIEENISIEINKTIKYNLTVNQTANITFENLTINNTINLTQNYTNISIINFTTNISSNMSLNISNVTYNLTLNITDINQIYNLTLSNETIEIINIISNISNETEFVIGNATITNFSLPLIKLNNILKLKGMSILDYSKDTFYNLKIGPNEQNYVSIFTQNLTNLDIDFIKDNSSKFESLIFNLNYTASVKINLESKNVDAVLKCKQYDSQEGCKKWIETDIPIRKIFDGYEFELMDKGYYVLSNKKSKLIKYVPTNSVYYNTNCEKCEKVYDCNAEDFCVVQNKLYEGYNFVAQLDFDVHNLGKLSQAQLCAYVSYNGREPLFNYIKYVPQSHCSHLDQINSASDIISYKYVEGQNKWECIDATELLKESQRLSESNLFINWYGPNIENKGLPFTCYEGISELQNCGGYNPSGHKDCRPYLQINYK